MENMVNMDIHLINDADSVIDSLKNLNARFDGKKILLTGGAGFLGSQLTHYFLRLNDRALFKNICHLEIWDNFQRGIPTWLDTIKTRKDLSLKDFDVTKENKPDHPDFIIHAASIASPTYYRKYPIETIDANVTGVRNLLNYSMQNSIESFLFFSTSEIYGDPDPSNIPTREDYRGFVSCTGPRACYDESKRLGETLCVNFWQQYKVPVKIARPFNNYGPGLKITDKRVLPDFFKDVILNNNITLLSDGRATRTFCYISDAIEGYLRLLLSDYNGEFFNIGTDKPEISMRELAELIITITNKKLKVEFVKSEDKNYLVDNPQRRCPSIDKAKKLLQYNPKVSLTEGLERTYLYYLNNIHEMERQLE